MPDRYLIRLPWPDKRLAPHAKGHWRPKHAATKVARQAAFVLARAQGIKNPMPDARITMTYYPPDKRCRDAHNMPAMLKASIDGLADAMGCDDVAFQVTYPTAFADPIKGGAVLMEVEPVTVEIEHRGIVT